MNLKPLVASLCALGVTSLALAGSAFAAEGQELEAMKQKIARMEALLDQNQGQAHSFSQLPLKNWQDRVTVSGLVNVDALWSTRTPQIGWGAGSAAAAPRTQGRFPLATKAYDDIEVANANLYVDAEMNCYTTAHMSLNYYGNNARVNDIPRFNGAGVTVAAPTATAINGMGIDEAYVTISNFAETPLYLRVGTQYFDFGTYDRYYITAPMTQLFSATRNSGATLGFNSASGFNASAYLFSGMNSVQDVGGYFNTAGNAVWPNRTNLNNGGVHIGYMGGYNGVEYKLAADYLYNMWDVNHFASVMDTTTHAGYEGRNGAWALHVGLVANQWDANVDVVSAASRFHEGDIGFTNKATYPAGSPNGSGATDGARPGAWGLDVGYSFASGCLPSRVAVGYQRSWEALGVASATYGSLPHNRWQAQYGVELGRNTDLTFQVVNDRDYGLSDAGRMNARSTSTNNALVAGTNRSATTGVVRLGVRFA